VLSDKAQFFFQTEGGKAHYQHKAESEPWKYYIFLLILARQVKQGKIAGILHGPFERILKRSAQKPKRTKASMKTEGSPRNGAGPRTTLLNYALACGRDMIAFRLLRAGASPLVTPDLPATALDQTIAHHVLLFFLNIPSIYAMWILHCVAKMRKLSAQRAETDACAVCGARAVSVLQFHPCEHYCCEECMWQRMSSLENGHGFGCPKCKVQYEDPDKESTTEEYNRAMQVHSLEQRRERKLSSYRKFERLSAENVETKSPLRRATCDLLAASQLDLGDSQPERSAALWAAALNGNAYRVMVLVDAGVDVDATNEYGQTALCLAAWCGHEKVVHTLINAGCNVMHEANGGISAWQTAAANGHEEALQLLLAEKSVEREHSSNGEHSRNGEHRRNGEHNDEHKRGSSKRESDSIFESNQAPPSLHLHPVQVVSAPDAGDTTVYANYFVVDGAFDEAFLQRLDQLSQVLPIAAAIKGSNDRIGISSRQYYCDTEGWVGKAFARAFHALPRQQSDQIPEGGCASDSAHLQSDSAHLLPHMRFLRYRYEGGDLPPHVDLSRTDRRGRRSTHTFLLYLCTNERGGATALLPPPIPASKHKSSVAFEKEPMGETVKFGTSAVSTALGCYSQAEVSPVRGRLFVFPHMCLHAGLPVIDTPKHLLRGEVRWGSGISDAAADVVSTEAKSST
jgi:hypothetical protein